MISVAVLGPVVVAVDGSPVDQLRPAARALLARLALAGGRAVSVEQLVDDLWAADDLPGNPGAALRVIASRSRKAVRSGAAVAFEQGGYRLADADLDAVRFADLVTDGRRHFEQGRPEHAASDLRAALSLWRGEALADVRFAPFAAGQVTRLELERLAVIEQRVAADLACGRHNDLVSELAGLVGEHPLQEGLWAHRMVALYRAGRQAEALRAFAEVREILAEQLGLEPGPELRRLEEAILQQRGDLEPPPPRPSVSASGIGAVASARSPILGRDDELQSLRGRFATQRVVSLVGPAGVGKTRLAVEAAATLGQHDELEVHLVELATVTDPASVGDEIATRLGAPSQRQGDALRTVASRLHGRPVLLVLDNCEQLRAAVANAVETLLDACPQLAVLVTSRIPLWVDGEDVVRLEPLPLDAAIELFRARCGIGRHDDNTAVAAICRAVDGLPLAVELAAGLTRSLTVDQVADRISDRFHLLTIGRPTAIPHHQTLRAALEWGHDLLDDDDRVLLRRLAVFAGGWTLDLAEAVCSDDDLERGTVAPALARLVEASMVTFTDDVDAVRRFGMLDTLRHFASEQLERAGEGEVVRAAHLQWCLGLAANADDAGSAVLLEREFANVRGTLDAAADSPLAGVAGDLLLVLQRSWLMHGHLDDARRLLLQYAGNPSLPDARRAELYGHAGNHSLHAGCLRDAEQALDLGLPLARRGRDDFVLAENRYFRGIVDVQRARAEPARDAFTEVLAIMRRMDRQTGISAALDCLADVADLRGDHVTAVRHRDAADAVDRAIGDQDRLATGLARRAIGAINVGELDEARAAVEEAQRIAADAPSSLLNAWVDEAVGRLATATGDVPVACAAHAAALRAYEEIGTDHDRCAVHLDLAAGALAADELDRAVAELRLGLPPLAEAGVDRFVADGLDLAASLIAPSDPVVAAQIAATVDAFRRANGVVATASARRRYDAWAPAVRAQLGEQWESLWSSTPPRPASDELSHATAVAMDTLVPAPAHV